LFDFYFLKDAVYNDSVYMLGDKRGNTNPLLLIMIYNSERVEVELTRMSPKQ